MQETNRIEPQLPVHARMTYSVSAPAGTHFRAATCEEVDCGMHSGGWVSVIDERTELGQAQAHYIRKESGRGFREDRRPDGMTAFTFPAGQTCFNEHTVRNGRTELYVVRGGDHRGNPRGDVRVHVSAANWVEDFAEHQQTLADRLAQG